MDMNLDHLDKIENKLSEIRELLNPEDSPYVCDTIVISIADEELDSLVKEMLARMGYQKKMVGKILKIVSEIQK